MTHWIYENWVAENKAVIHTAQCGYCKNGQGCHPNPLGRKNGQWLGPFESLALAQSAAKSTGKPIRLHSCCKSKALIGALSACVVIAGCSCSPEPTMLERYPGPWVEDFDLPITKTLAANDVRICGQYKFRESSRDKGEYLVYCSTNGKRWTAFTVWVHTEKIMGPYPADPKIPP